MASSSSLSSATTTTATETASSNRKPPDFDLEISNLDTNQVYKNEDELIPTNSRIEISRVVCSGNSVPVKSNGAYTTLYKNINHHRPQYDEISSDSDSEESQKLSLSSSSLTTTKPYKPPEMMMHSANAPPPPPSDLLCPFEDKEKKERHLINEAVLVPCCGHFICCKSCLRDTLNKQVTLECPYPGCSQEITPSTHLPPHYIKRQKAGEYLSTRQQQCDQSPLVTRWPSHTIITDSISSITLEKVIVAADTSKSTTMDGHSGHSMETDKATNNQSRSVTNGLNTRVCENGKQQFANIRNLRFNPNFKATITNTHPAAGSIGSNKMTNGLEENATTNNQINEEPLATTTPATATISKQPNDFLARSPRSSRSASTDSSVSDITSVTSSVSGSSRSSSSSSSGSSSSSSEEHDTISVGSNSDVSDDEEDETNYMNSLAVKAEPMAMEEGEAIDDDDDDDHDSPASSSQFNTPSFDSASTNSSGNINSGLSDQFIGISVESRVAVEYHQDDIMSTTVVDDQQFDYYQQANEAQSMAAAHQHSPPPPQNPYPPSSHIYASYHQTFTPPSYAPSSSSSSSIPLSSIPQSNCSSSSYEKSSHHQSSSLEITAESRGGDEDVDYSSNKEKLKHSESLTSSEDGETLMAEYERKKLERKRKHKLAAAAAAAAAAIAPSSSSSSLSRHVKRARSRSISRGSSREEKDAVVNDDVLYAKRRHKNSQRCVSRSRSRSNSPQRTSSNNSNYLYGSRHRPSIDMLKSGAGRVVEEFGVKYDRRREVATNSNYYNKEAASSMPTSRDVRPSSYNNKWSPPHTAHYETNDRHRGYQFGNSNNRQPDFRNPKYYNGGVPNWKKRPEHDMTMNQPSQPHPRYQNRQHYNEPGYRNEHAYRVNYGQRYEYSMQNHRPPFYKRGMNEGQNSSHFPPPHHHYIQHNRYESSSSSSERRRASIPDDCWIDGGSEFRKDYHHNNQYQHYQHQQGFVHNKTNQIRNLKVTLSKDTNHRVFSSCSSTSNNNNTNNNSSYTTTSTGGQYVTEREEEFRQCGGGHHPDEMTGHVINTNKRSVYLKADMAPHSSSHHHNFPPKNNTNFSYAKEKNTEHQQQHQLQQQQSAVPVSHESVASSAAATAESNNNNNDFYKSVDLDQIEGYDVLDIMVSDRDNLL